jgi:hypothetical protein
MKDINIERLSIDRLIPYANNSRTHSPDQVAQIAASIREFGFTNPVLIDSDDGIIAGHGRVLAARKLGLDEVPCIKLGHLSEMQRRAYVIADNKLALNAGWDDALLKLELDALSKAGFDISLTGFDAADFADLSGESDDSYTRKVEAPKYEPKGDKPKIEELFDESKTKKIISEIEASKLSDSEKSFLIAAAHRHTVFNFERIAEYYAHSEKPTQELMENSALVIIDFNKAIELGFVALSKGVRDLYTEDNPNDDE